MDENINHQNQSSKNDYGKYYVSILGYPDFENPDGQLIKELYAHSEEVSDSKSLAENNNEILSIENNPDEDVSKYDLSTPCKELDDTGEDIDSLLEAYTLLG